MEKISVIIPTYNRTKYIDRAINSVINQSYKNFEIIVVDDNPPNSESRDTTSSLMEKYKENTKVIYIKHPKNLNGANARNTGIKYSTGDYITFLDDDDYFFPQRFERIIKTIKERKVDGLFTASIITKNGKIVDYIDGGVKEQLQLQLLKCKSFFGTGSNMFFKAECVKALGGFDVSFLRHQDLEFMMRFLDKYKISSLDEALVVKNTDDRSNEIDAKKSIKYRFYYLSKFKKIIEKYNTNEIQQIYKYNIIDLIRISINNNDKDSYYYLLNELSNYKIKLRFSDKTKIVLMKLNRIIRVKDIIDIMVNKLKRKKITKYDIDYIYKMNKI